jgi:hypothetical protein
MVSSSNHGRRRCRSASSALVCVLVLAVLLGAWGRKGPPLPPLLKQPAAPVELRAERHGDVVDVQFNVPSTNIDGTRPANVTRIDVYGLTAKHALSEADAIKFGTRIASVKVKAPADPNQTVEADEVEEVELVPEGLEPGARAHVQERLTAETLTPVTVTPVQKEPHKLPPVVAPSQGPLLAPVLPVTTRLYVGVSVTTKGKNGPSAHAVVAMVDAPPAPGEPSVNYDEKNILITWPPIPGAQAAAAPAEGVLPSRTIGVSAPSVAYNVYEVSGSTPPTLSRLTDTPVKEARLVDKRLTWGERRCYAVRAYVTLADASLEGPESPTHCETLKDTFPPAAPKGLQAVPSEGAISLIWDANPEGDIRGYIVLRGPASGEKFEPLFTDPIQETSFQDHAQSGVRFAYAVQAVDNAGNASPLSTRVEETAR